MMRTALLLCLGLALAAPAVHAASDATVRTAIAQAVAERFRAASNTQVVVEDLLGPEDALRLIRESLALYRQLRRGELKHA